MTVGDAFPEADMGADVPAEPGIASQQTLTSAAEGAADALMAALHDSMVKGDATAQAGMALVRWLVSLGPVPDALHALASGDLVPQDAYRAMPKPWSGASAFATQRSNFERDQPKRLREIAKAKADIEAAQQRLTKLEEKRAAAESAYRAKLFWSVVSGIVVNAHQVAALGPAFVILKAMARFGGADLMRRLDAYAADERVIERIADAIAMVVAERAAELGATPVTLRSWSAVRDSVAPSVSAADVDAIVLAAADARSRARSVAMETAIDARLGVASAIDFDDPFGVVPWYAPCAAVDALPRWAQIFMGVAVGASVQRTVREWPDAAPPGTAKPDWIVAFEGRRAGWEAKHSDLLPDKLEP